MQSAESTDPNEATVPEPAATVPEPAATVPEQPAATKEHDSLENKEKSADANFSEVKSEEKEK